MIDHNIAAPINQFSITTRPNQSLSMMGTVYVFLVISLIALIVGMAFAMVGAWPVLIYTLAVLIALRLGFQQVWMHAGDYEQLWVEDDKLLVEVCELGQKQTYQFSRYWAGIKARYEPGGDCTHLVIFSHGNEIHLGRHMSSHQRLACLAKLKSVLRLAESG